MLKEVKKSAVVKMLPKRSPDSHKGDNGKVLIVGGSIDYYGAPVLAGLGALYSGADLVYLYVPECNFECTRSLYPDFIVKKFKGEYLSRDSVKDIVKFGKSCDSILIGPGLGEDEEIVSAVKDIVFDLHIPTVLDASGIFALKKINKFPLEQPVVVTPHLNEFQHLVDREVTVTEEDSKSVVLLRSLSMDLHINVLLKGPTDFVASEEGYVRLNHTGNSGMTVGGSGDVLAGVVASFLAQGLEGFAAGQCAAYINGKAGDLLKKQKGCNFSASDLATALPYSLK